MRIAFIGQKGIPAQFGGVERHVDELSRELAERGHAITVYVRSWFTPKHMRYHGQVRLVHIPSIHTKNLDTITHVFFSLFHAMREKPDIIHIHGVGPALLSWIPRLFSPGIKVVVTFHCVDRLQKKWGFFARTMLHIGEWAACRFPHKTIVVSRVLQEYCREQYQAVTDYVSNGVIPQCYPPGSMLTTWHLKREKYVLVMSRLIPHKGVHYVIDAWKKLQSTFPRALRGYTLVVGGGTYFGDTYLKDLERLAANDESIVFTGWVNGVDVGELMANCVLFIHPSDVEGLPIAVLEAMACKRPVLVSDIPEHRELVHDRRLWFKRADSVSLAERLGELLTNKRLRTASVDRHFKNVTTLYAWPKIARAIEKTYLTILDE